MAALGGMGKIYTFGPPFRAEKSGTVRHVAEFWHVEPEVCFVDLDGIIEMIYALDKVAPGTANDDTLLYGVEVKFYNMEVEVDSNLMTCHDGLYIIGDGSGITHSLSHASASGVHVARQISKQ